MKWLVVCSVIAVVLTPGLAYAEPTPRTDLLVSPAITEWLVAPGETLKKEVMVSNNTKDPLPVSAIMRPFQLQGAQQPPLEAAVRYDVSEWLDVKDGDFILKPEQHRKVTLTLSVPKDAPPGGHYGTVYFRQMRPLGSGGAEARVGALVFITVKGEITKTLEGKSMDARWDGDGLSATAALYNSGNTHVMPEGEFIVTDWSGAEVGRMKLPQGMTMPHTTRQYRAEWKGKGFGIYTVKPVVWYGNRQRVDLPYVTIWMFPWQAMLGGAIVAAIAWFGFFRIRSRWKRAVSALTHRSL